MATTNSYVAILDVGHGNSTVLHDQNKSIVVDCGPGTTLLEFVLQEGITQIDYIFLSHADQDHIEGLVGLISSKICKIGCIYVNADSTKKSALWNDLLFTTTRDSLPIHVGLSHITGPFSCGNIVLEVVGPSQFLAGKSAGSIDNVGNRINSNSLSASFKILWAGSVIAYLAGDIDHVSLNDINTFHYDIMAPLLVFPHHGGNAGVGNVVKFTEDLCDLVKATTVIFSIGRDKHSNPRQDVIKAVRTKIKDVRIACTQMSKFCSMNLSISPVHLHEFHSRGRMKNHCCSGTFVINLDATGITYSPDPSSHDAFISAAAPTPLCKN